MHVDPAGSATGIDATLLESSTISGTVTDPQGDPAPDICVDLNGGSPTGATSVLTDAAGQYTFTSLRAGQYGLEFSDCGQTGPYLSESWDDNPTGSPEPIAVGDAQDVAGIDAQLALDLPPETTITFGPSGTGNQTDVAFSFESDEPGASFECSLDGDPFTACASPNEYAGLSDTSHTFSVRAIDGLGQPDPTPASRTWTVESTATSQTTSGNVDAGGTVNTDPNGSGATPRHP